MINELHHIGESNCEKHCSRLEHSNTLIGPDREAHNQIDHILIDWKWHSSMCDLSAELTDNEHGVMVVKCRERPSVSKQAALKLYTERFTLD